MDQHELLLKAIKARQEKLTEFNYGILTADRYVQSISECIGSDLCYRYAGTRGTSFNDLMTKAAKTLTYANEDMRVIDVYGQKYTFTDTDGDEVELALPKHTLMVFKHVLTTPRKDRDGDVMRTQGAKPDPKMLLLWQHVATLPIGKMLQVHEHNSKRLVLISAIVDMNDLAHDAAVMVDNDMGRFSHGFKALEFNKIKDHEDKSSEGGFDVTSFEIMEESLVSIPSNTDAQTLEVIVGLAEGGKLTSPMMKAVGKSIRSKMPTQIGLSGLKLPISIDLDVKVNGQSISKEGHHGTEAGKTKCTGKTGCNCGCGGDPSASKEEEIKPGTEEGSDQSKMKCPKCGSPMKGGVCTKCGYGMTDKDKDADPDGEKGATVSLNSAGKSHATSLVSAGKVSDAGSWSGPSADAENSYIEENGIEEFGKWHLGKREGVDPKTKAAWAYPFSSDFKTVSRAGLNAIRQRAGQQDASGIFAAAGKLIDAIDAKKDAEPDGQKGGPGSGRRPHGAHPATLAALSASHQAHLSAPSIHSAGALTHAIHAATYLEGISATSPAGRQAVADHHREAANHHEAAKYEHQNAGNSTAAGLHEAAEAAHNTASKLLGGKDSEVDIKAPEWVDSKMGRAISAKNKELLQHAHKCMQNVHDNEHLVSMGGKSLLREGMKAVMDVANTDDMMGGEAHNKPTVKDAMSLILAKADPLERLRMKEALIAMEALDRQSADTEVFMRIARN